MSWPSARPSTSCTTPSAATSTSPATARAGCSAKGITAFAYTWAQLRDLVDAPPQPGERGHPVRVFLGSGMPRGLWRRVEERFAPARVLEFWASTETGAILANVSSAKRGSLGRPLPGSTEVRIAAYDLDRACIVEDARGLALEAAVDEPGLLLARVTDQEQLSSRPLRSLFRRGD